MYCVVVRGITQDIVFGMSRMLAEWKSSKELRESFGGDFEQFCKWSRRSGYSEKRVCRKRGDAWVWGVQPTKESLARWSESWNRRKPKPRGKYRKGLRWGMRENRGKR
jgi:hypothetical protein